MLFIDESSEARIQVRSLSPKQAWRQADEEFLVERIKFILAVQLMCVHAKDPHYLRMGDCIVDRAFLKKHANMFWVKDDIIFLKQTGSFKIFLCSCHVIYPFILGAPQKASSV